MIGGVKSKVSMIRKPNNISNNNTPVIRVGQFNIFHGRHIIGHFPSCIHIIEVDSIKGFTHNLNGPNNGSGVT